MTDFHDVSFPTSISFKSEGGPVFKTQIANLNSGLEKRNILWSKARAEYEISYKDISKNETNQIINFFMARRGRAYGFRFKDWNDFEAKNITIAIGDGTTKNFQLIKTYGDEANNYTRIITKPIEGSVVIYIDEVQKESGFRLNYNSGIISFDNPITNGEELTVDFEFDIPVRFGEDTLLAKNESYTKSSIKKIKLVEIK